MANITAIHLWLYLGGSIIISYLFLFDTINLSHIYQFQLMYCAVLRNFTIYRCILTPAPKCHYGVCGSS